MAYGTIKVDNITFDNGGVDKLITVSGLFFSTSGALTVTGTISGGNVVAPTATFTTLTGTTTAGTTATFTSGSFTSLTGVTATISSGIFAAGSATAPSVAVGTGTTYKPGIYSPAADQLAISTGGTQRINIEADGDINIDSGGVFYDATNNRLGIGTTSPGAKLHVAAGANVALQLDADTDLNTSIALSENGSIKWYFGSLGADDSFRFYDNTAATERLRITSAGNVGIGTTSPASLLDVATSNSGITLTNTAVSNKQWRLGGNNSGYFLITETGVADRFTIDTSGNVGIGTTSPGYSLDVRPTGLGLARVGSQDTQAGLYISSGNGSSPFINFLTSTSTLRAAIYTAPSSDDLIFANGASATERARIDSSGRLLVGTSSARSNFFNSTLSSALQLEGADTARRFSVVGVDGAPYIILGRDKSGAVGNNTLVANNDNLGVVSFQGNDGAQFVEGAAIEAFVDGTPGANDMPGRLVFSTTADGAASPTERMRITSAGSILSFAASANDAITAGVASSAGATPYLFAGVHSRTGTAAGGTLSYSVAANGNVQNTNGSYTTISDAKLKENIVDAGSQWDDFKVIRICNWNYKAETGHQTHRQIGPIANELEAVCPGLVFETPDRDEDGNETGEVTKGVNQSVLYMKAVKALQEAMERIETLEANNADMLARLTALEAA